MKWRTRLFGKPFNLAEYRQAILRMVLGQKMKMTAEEMLLVFSRFCHPIKNPLNRQFLKLVRVKTVALAEKALEAVPVEDRTVLEKIVRQYERVTLYQERLLRLIERAGRRGYRKIVNDAKRALAAGKAPVRPSHGCSGAYYMPGVAVTVAGVFKPFDEEIGAPNNPRQFQMRGPLGQRAGHFNTCVGEGLFREMAAYEIDQMLGLGIVPYTTCTSFEHKHFYENREGHARQECKKKIGSFQEFKAGYYHIYEVNEKGLEGLPLDQLQRVVILDCLLGNQDRNIGNLLTNGKEVVAIDHGYSLAPGLIKTPLLRSLMKLPQMQLPFSPYLAKKLEALDVDKLSHRLRKKCFIDERALGRMRERLALVKAAMAHGLSVKDIVMMMHPRFLCVLYEAHRGLRKRAQVLARIMYTKRMGVAV